MKNPYCYIKPLLSGLFVLILFLLTSVATKAQTVNADSTKFPIGSQVKVTIQMPLKADEKITWPVFGDTITKSIEIVSKTKLDTIVKEGSQDKILTQTLHITSFDTGFIVFPPVPFVINKNGQSETVKTEPLLLEVFKVKVDLKSDIKDIKPIIKAPLTFRELLPWIAAFIILGLLIYGAIYYLKKRKAAPIEKPQPKIIIPAWEIALQKLNNLKNEQIWQKGDIKEYYTRLTDILRDYFEARFKVNAAEMTSSEILDALRHHISEEKPWDSLKNILFLSDMAKFAKAQPGTYENEQSIIYASEIIKTTIPNQVANGIKDDSHIGINKKTTTE